MGRHLFYCAAPVLGVVFSSSIVLAGPYSPAAGQPGSTAISRDDANITEWASGVVNYSRGPMDIANPDLGLASFGDGSDALGSGTTVTSLGDGGSITLSFDLPITDGAGADFAVFENSFSGTFLELAFVEVSSNGTDFFRFPSVSLTQTSTQVGGFGTLDPTNLYDLAGNFSENYGTPFDLSELTDVSPLLDINAVTQVRIVDVVGRITPIDGNPNWAPSTDSLGNLINDPYSTPFPSSGFDLDGVAVLHVVPEPTGLVLAGVVMVAGLFRRRRVIG